MLSIDNATYSGIENEEKLAGEYRTLLEAHSKYLDRNNKYYFYCQKGVQSHKLCSYLSSIGYDVVNVAGGYEAWILEK